MGKRFAIVIGMAAAGVMALGAQTALAGGESVDSIKPDLQVSAKKKQNPQNDGPICDGVDCAVIVDASCGDEECTTRATGKLTNVNKDKLAPEISVLRPGQIEPGQRFNVGPELAKESQRKQVRKALDNGKNVQAKVTVKATDAAGNVATAKLTIKIVKHAPGRGRGGEADVTS